MGCCNGRRGARLGPPQARAQPAGDPHLLHCPAGRPPAALQRIRGTPDVDDEWEDTLEETQVGDCIGGRQGNRAKARGAVQPRRRAAAAPCIRALATSPTQPRLPTAPWRAGVGRQAAGADEPFLQSPGLPNVAGVDCSGQGDTAGAADACRGGGRALADLAASTATTPPHTHLPLTPAHSSAPRWCGRGATASTLRSASSWEPSAPSRVRWAAACGLPTGTPPPPPPPRAPVGRGQCPSPPTPHAVHNLTLQETRYCFSMRRCCSKPWALHRTTASSPPSSRAAPRSLVRCTRRCPGSALPWPGHTAAALPPPAPLPSAPAADAL